LFRIDSQNDIIQVASTLQGRGVFQNVPATRREGLEADAQYQTGQYLVYANYAFIDATYQFSGALASPNNPFADAKRKYLRNARQPDPRHTTASDQRWGRLLVHAAAEARHRRHLGQWPMVCW